MRLVVREIIKDLGDPFEEGQTIHDLISPVLTRGEEVEVDFEGTRLLCVPFLNAAMGAVGPFQRFLAGNVRFRMRRLSKCPFRRWC